MLFKIYKNCTALLILYEKYILSQIWLDRETQNNTWGSSGRLRLQCVVIFNRRKQTILINIL